MNKRIAATATAAVLLLASTAAAARDTRLELSLQELLDSAQARDAGIDGSVRFYLAGQPHPAVKTRLGGDVANRKTNGVGKSDEESCRWVALSALKALQESARARGANAVIDIVSYFRKKEFSSPTHYECYAGNIMSGVAFKGTYVKID